MIDRERTDRLTPEEREAIDRVTRRAKEAHDRFVRELDGLMYDLRDRNRERHDEPPPDAGHQRGGPA